MRSTIACVSGYAYIVEIEPIRPMSGCLSLALYSVWDQAKGPTAERRVAQLNLDAKGLRDLRDLIDASLAQG